MSLFTWLRYLGEKKHDLAKATDLTLPEFRLIRIPDDFLRAVCIEVRSPAGGYHLDHKCLESRIHIESSHTDLGDFLRVQRLIASITGAEPGEHSFNPETICNELKARSLTHSSIADLAAQYDQAFGGSSITAVYYCCIPRSVYENSGIPKGKLALIEPVTSASRQ